MLCLIIKLHKHSIIFSVSLGVLFPSVLFALCIIVYVHALYWLFRLMTTKLLHQFDSAEPLSQFPDVLKVTVFEVMAKRPTTARGQHPWLKHTWQHGAVGFSLTLSRRLTCN